MSINLHIRRLRNIATTEIRLFRIIFIQDDLWNSMVRETPSHIFIVARNFSRGSARWNRIK
uniref:Uncharacterized protein n=1 Tax=Arundo donax TaxID=35708 RepID=A0A0A9GVA1_ARUDO